MPLPVGTRLGPYEIVAPIGAGGMGEVYKARDTRLDRDVAIKILSPLLAGDPDALARFEREALSVAKLSHPNILAIYEFGKDASAHAAQPAPYVVTELVDGETVRAKLANGPLSPRRAIAYAQQIARGIAAAHARGIVHRDLKPDNVMVTRDDRVKVLDFGLAKPVALTGDVTRAATVQTAGGVVLGTFAYMAPEQARRLEVDHRADIFAFGAVLYEMLSGERAFKGETAADTMTAVLSKEPPDLDLQRLSIPPVLDRIVRRCLEKSPDLRFQSANDLAFALETLSTGSTPPSGVVAPAAMSSGRGGRAIAAALAVLALGAAFAAGRYAGGRADVVQQPTFKRLTFRRGWISNARFAADGQSVVYSAIWDSETERIFPVRVDRPRAEAQPVGEGSLIDVSRSGDLAIRTHPERRTLFIERGTLAQTPPAGGEPRPVLEQVDDGAYGPDGRMAVVRTDQGRNRLELSPGGTVLYETGGWISSPRFSRDGSRLAFVEHPLRDDDRGWLAIVDMSTRAKRNVTEEIYTIHGLAWSPDGSELCFGSGSTLQCAAVSGATVRVAVRGPLRMDLDDIASDGRILAVGYIIHAQQTVGVPGGHEIDLSWQDSPLPIAFSHDGAHLLFGSAGYDIFFRNVNGSAPVHIGDGIPAAISADDRWVVAIQPNVPTTLALVPTGPGETRTLPRGAIDSHQGAAWTPDGRIVAMGNQKGHATRLFVQDVSGGDPKPITDEGVRLPRLCANAVSPDGRFVFGETPIGTYALYPLAGGRPTPLDLVGRDLVPIAWSNTPDVFYAQSRAFGRQASLYRADLASGKVEPWRTIGPTDLSGAPMVFWTVVSADGSQYAYGTTQSLTNLFLIDGVFTANASR